MIRGTTPTHTFTLPFEIPEDADVRIVYAQGEDHKERILFEVTAERCARNGRVVTVRLKQEETLLFDCTPTYHDGGYTPLPVKIQLGVQTRNDDVLWSYVINSTVDRCLRKDGRVRNG